jgi:hypothetical protein
MPNNQTPQERAQQAIQQAHLRAVAEEADQNNRDNRAPGAINFNPKTSVKASIMNPDGSIPKTNITPDKTMPPRDPEDFFTKELARKIKDPANQAYASAVALGKADAMKFIQDLGSPERPGHESALDKWVNKYKKDEAALYEDCINRSCSKYNAYPYMLKNITYENAVKKLFARPIRTEAEAAAQAGFYEELTKRWGGFGYRNDSNEVPKLAAKYGMTMNNSVRGFELHK